MCYFVEGQFRGNNSRNTTSTHNPRIYDKCSTIWPVSTKYFLSHLYRLSHLRLYQTLWQEALKLLPKTLAWASCLILKLRVAYALGMPGTLATSTSIAARACLLAVSHEVGSEENVPSVPGACPTPQFYVSGNRHMVIISWNVFSKGYPIVKEISDSFMEQITTLKQLQ